jgi:hypothetical protein
LAIEKRRPAAHRVAGDVGSVVPNFAEEVGEDAREAGRGGWGTGLYRRREAEARQVDGDHDPAGSEATYDRVPDPKAAAGPVDEQQGLTHAVDLMVETLVHDRIITEARR